MAAVTRTQEDFEAPFPGIDFPEGFARAHRDEIAHRRGVRPPPCRPRPTSTPSPPPSRGSLPPYRLHVTTWTMGPGAAIVPSIEVGVSTLWIATAVRDPRRPSPRGPGARTSRRRVGSRPAGAHRDGLDTPAADDGDGRDGQRGHRRRRPRGAARRLCRERSVPAAGAAALAEPRPGLRWDVFTVTAGAAVMLVAASLVLLLIAATASGTRSARAASSGRLSGLLRGLPAMSLGASFATDPAGSGRRSRGARRRCRGQHRRRRDRGSRRRHARVLARPPRDVTAPVRRRHRADVREQWHVRDRGR